MKIFVFPITANVKYMFIGSQAILENSSNIIKINLYKYRNKTLYFLFPYVIKNCIHFLKKQKYPVIFYPCHKNSTSASYLKILCNVADTQIDYD